MEAEAKAAEMEAEAKAAEMEAKAQRLRQKCAESVGDN
jgi:hypothetical protein